jgi:hypothetical protein
MSGCKIASYHHLNILSAAILGSHAIRSAERVLDFDPSTADPMNDSEILRNLDIGEMFQFFRSQDQTRGTDADLYDAALQGFKTLKLDVKNPVIQFLTSKLRKELNEAGAKRDLNRLLAFGLKEETLLAALFLFKFIPTIDETLRSALGDMKNRRRKAKLLREAACVMDEFSAITEQQPSPLQFDSSSTQQLATPGMTADALHFYANFLLIREQLLDALDANSGEENYRQIP